MASSEPSGKEAAVGHDDRFSMRFVINTLKSKWSQVPGVTTDTLHAWIQGRKGPAGHAENPQAGEKHGCGCSPVEKPRALTIIDARPDFEYIVGHIEGSKRVDFDTADVQEIVTELQRQQQAGQIPTVVCYCSLGYRSCKYADTLMSTVKNDPILNAESVPKIEVYNLEGSLFKWANENRGHMIDGKGRATKYVHPFSPIWGKLLYKPLRKHKLDD